MNQIDKMTLNNPANFNIDKIYRWFIFWFRGFTESCPMPLKKK
jgi:hypothetical protein